MDSIEKGELGEKFVNDIAYKSFLKYWCYPGPLDIVTDNKEICDLLIVFNGVCIIISVKNYSFKGDYDKYFRKTTSKAIRQIKGAERTLFRDSTPVLLKHPDRNPEPFSKAEINEVYRIVVNLNTEIKYYQTSHYLDGNIYIVMDALAWSAAIGELNSIPDFKRYISERCAMFGQYPAYILPRGENDMTREDEESAQQNMELTVNGEKCITIVCGSELDLIALYFRHVYKFPTELYQKGIDQKNETPVKVLNIDGEWDKFKKSNVSKVKKGFENSGYFIDSLIREFVINQKGGNHLAKMFFQLDRLQRGGFAREFLEFHKNTPRDLRFHRRHMVCYSMNMVFLYFEESYSLEERNEFLEISLLHHHFLFNCKCEEVGAIGMSKSNNEFLLGYSKLGEPYTETETEVMRSTFAKMGWRTEPVNISDFDKDLGRIF